METLTLNAEGLKELMSHKQEEIGNMAKEIAENEWELFELNLFLSSFGKEFLNQTSKEVIELRNSAANGEIDLSEYEKLAENF